MKKGWLAYAGPYKIEQTPGRDFAGDVDMSAPPKGVLHTTEGYWDGSMSVFRSQFSPHFLVDRGRIAQLLPLGRAASTLERRDGMPPTNGVCRVQIEIVGFSQRMPWLPPAETVDALARLMAELERVAEIPLRYVRADRNPGVFASASGWVGHGDVPGNSHWDPGVLDWDRLLGKARGYRASDTGLASRTGYWSWLAWYLGESDWKPYGPRNPRVRPNVPSRVPRGWWPKLRVFLRGRK